MNPLLRAVGIPETILQESTGAWGRLQYPNPDKTVVTPLCDSGDVSPSTSTGYGDAVLCCFTTHLLCLFAPSAKSHVCACSFFRKTLLTKSVCTGLQQTRKQQLAQQRGPERVASPRSAMRSWLTPRQLSEARQALRQNGYGLNECERVLKFLMNLIWVMCYLVHCG